MTGIVAEYRVGYNGNPCRIQRTLATPQIGPFGGTTIIVGSTIGAEILFAPSLSAGVVTSPGVKI